MDFATVRCRGDCECPDGAKQCTLSAVKDAAKDATLSCGSSAQCTVNCVGESACAGDTEILADGATAKLTVRCYGKDACKGDTLIDCGSVKLCSLTCTDETSCDNIIVDASKASFFECTGLCNAIGRIKTSAAAKSVGALAEGITADGEAEDEQIEPTVLQLQGNANGSILMPDVIGEESSDGNQTSDGVGDDSANNSYHINVSLSSMELVSMWILALTFIACTTTICYWRYAKRGAASRFQ